MAFINVLRRWLVSSKAANAILVGAALGSYGCSAPQGDAPGENPGKASEDLYLLGTTWHNGIVPVCYDGVDGDNQPLIEEAQRVLTSSWTSATDVTFANWGRCDQTVNVGPSLVALHFCGGTSNSVYCPAKYYDQQVVKAGAFRGLTSRQGPLPATCFPQFGNNIVCTPGVTDVSLISDDPDAFLTRFRYQVIHEFGHALGFEHEQDRPDNFDNAGNTVFCGPANVQSAFNTPGGTYETPFDVASIMDYCARDPLTGLVFPTMLSSGDIMGVRKVYGRKTFVHGFMIKSDRNPGLAVNAFGGADEGTVLKLHDSCTLDNPDCTWSYQRGMIVSDNDPTLAINAFGGAGEGTVLKLTRACTPANPDCTWTYRNGEFQSDTDPTLAINAFGGARLGVTLKLTRACTAGNPDCTWTLPNVMLSSNRDTTLGINAFGGAHRGGSLKLHDACEPANPDCTWTFTKGMILSDTNSALAMSPFFGARDGASVVTVVNCTKADPACTWTWSHGQLISGDTTNGILPLNAFGGALQLTDLRLESACTAQNPDCVFSGLFARAQ